MKKYFFIPLILVLGCTSAIIVEPGDTVSLHYTGTLDDGSVFDSSEGRDPLSFTAGAGQMIPGFDQAVLGMSNGEEKTFTIPASEAYGEVREDLVQEVSKADLVDNLGMEPVVGMVLQNSMGMIGRITSISEETVIIDFNHELAGQALTFTVRIIDIQRE